MPFLTVIAQNNNDQVTIRQQFWGKSLTMGHSLKGIYFVIIEGIVSPGLMLGIGVLVLFVEFAELEEGVVEEVEEGEWL